MKVFVVLVLTLAVAFAQGPYKDEPTRPYSFNYVAEGDEGKSSHEETSDGTGTVRGSYTMTLIDGRDRVVEYIAGPDGFTANIRTNEPGTDSSNPADVVIISTAEGAKAPSDSGPIRTASVRTGDSAPRTRMIYVPAPA